MFKNLRRLFKIRDSRMPKRKLTSSAASSSKSKKRKTGGQVSEDDNYVFFFRKECTFSQFHPSNFTDKEGRTFNCMEQYMHYHKAVTFKDDKMAEKIMKTDDPKLHKKYGRQVSNFDPEVWGKRSIEIVKEGNVLKYKQNPDMKKELYATGKKTLVEASPFDKIWGVGLAHTNKKIHNKRNWRGKNLLGYALTSVRDQLMKEEGLIKDDTDSPGERETMMVESLSGDDTLVDQSPTETKAMAKDKPNQNQEKRKSKTEIKTSVTNPLQTKE